MRSYAVFKFTQRAIENRSTCHAWHACRRLPTPVLDNRLTNGGEVVSPTRQPPFTPQEVSWY
jgi:hypothetical protein